MPTCNTPSHATIEIGRKALIDLLCDVLETEPDRLDPKDVMRYHPGAYEFLYTTQGESK